MPVTREYLEEQLAHLSKQAEQAFATIHSANGAISAIKHLLSVLDAEEAQGSVPTETEETPCPE